MKTLLLGGAALALVATGCGSSGTVFAVGDCISIQTDNRGQAVRQDNCASMSAIQIKAQAKGGQRPDCGEGYNMTKGTMARYVQDLVTNVTYCGF